MKSIFLSLIMISISTLSFSQNKNAKASIEVDGVCMMCKTRIEKASLKTKGVKSASFALPNNYLTLNKGQKEKYMVVSITIFIQDQDHLSLVLT